MRLAAIYARVSTEEQTRGLIPSTGTQVAACKKTAADLGIPVATESRLLVEEQHSGADLRWLGTQFMDLVHRAQRHEFTDLICLDIDRFCRGGLHAYFEQEGYFRDAGITIHWVHSDVPDDMPFAGTIKAARAEAAQWARQQIRDASMRNRTAYAEQGNIIPGNVPPFGFQFVTDPSRRTKRNLPVVVGLVPDPVTGPALLHITEWVANGGAVGALPDWLASQGIRTARGGSLVWRRSTILDILHNHTNYGGRRSHKVHDVPRAEGHHRDISMKTRNERSRIPLDNQHRVADGRVTPPEGLTYDLWKRAVDRLAENKELSARHATLPEDQRAERGLLFGGMVRCKVCKGGLRIKPTSKEKHTANAARWEYTCYHTGTSHAKEPPVSMTTKKLDGAVWEIAVEEIRDESFLMQLIADTDQRIVAPVARAASLRARLAEADGDHARLMKRLRKLDADDPDDAGLMAEYEADLKAIRATRAELTDSLAAAEADLQTEEARRATLTAFREYAARERPTLDQKTPLERRNILRALRTRCRLGPGAHLNRLAVRFDIRHLPGAIAALHAARDADWREDNMDNDLWYENEPADPTAFDDEVYDLSEFPHVIFIEDDEQLPQQQLDAEDGILASGGERSDGLENGSY